MICASNSSWIKTKISEKNFLIDYKTVTEVYIVFGGVSKYSKNEIMNL
jgi:hypothetical protein